MSPKLRTALFDTLLLHIGLSKTRIETLVIVIIGLVNGRTVNLSHLASQFPGNAKHASNYRRLQRFFQHVRLDQEMIARIVMRMLNLNRPVMLALDRTNWKIGSKDMNVLMLAVVTRRFRIPLLWVLLNHQGNSNTGQRLRLMQQYLDLFGASSIELLLADREFIGADWMNFLNKNNIPFAIRMRSGNRIVFENGSTWSFNTLVRGRRARTKPMIWTGWFTEGGTTPQERLSFVAKQLKTREWLIVATNVGDPKQALNAYRKRWAIECLFADTKTRGFNLEDTHITAPHKISTMLSALTLAIIWVYRCATTSMGMKAIKRKSHRRREKSWFRVGFDTLRQWIIYKPDKAQFAWTSVCPKRIRLKPITL